MHDRDPVGGMRVRVALGRPAVGRPAGVPNAGRALKRLARELAFEVAQLAFGAPAHEAAGFQRGDARRVIAAVFEALERIDELHRDRLAAEYADNSAHGAAVPSLDAGRNHYPGRLLPGVNAAAEITIRVIL